MQMVIDPNEYLTLQSKLFASFNNINVDILLLGIVVILLIVPFVVDDINQFVMDKVKEQQEEGDD